MSQKNIQMNLWSQGRRITRMRVFYLVILTLALCTQCSHEAPVKPPEDGLLRKLVFNAKDQQGSYKLYTINDDGSGLKEIFLPNSSMGDLRVSPQGDRVVCVVNLATLPSTNYQLFLVHTNGSSAEQLTYDLAGLPEEPQWFPNGEEILYGYYGTWRGAQIFRIRIDDSSARRITTDDTTSHRFPRLSPDGQKIAFETRGRPNKIWVMNADGVNQILLSTPEYDAWGPEWTLDSKQVIYWDQKGLWIINADASNRKQLCENVGTPHVNPVNGKIALIGYQGLYTIDPDGSRLTKLVDVYINGYPILWSQDGAKIAFVGDSNGDRKLGLCTINANGTNLREITSLELEGVRAPYNRTFDWIP